MKSIFAKPQRKKLYISLACFGALAILLGLYLLVLNPRIQREKLSVKIDAAIERQDWSEVLALNTRFLELTKRDKYYYPQAVSEIKFTLGIKRLLLEDFFSFTQLSDGFNMLFPLPVKPSRMMFEFFTHVGMPEHWYQSSNISIDRLMFELLLSKPDNPYAFEYVILLNLIEKQHDSIVPAINEFLYIFDYKHIPRHLEEALLIHLGNPGLRIMNFRIGNNLRINPTTVRRYTDFLMYFSQFRDEEISIEFLQEEFGNTYWFYLFFLRSASANS